jgi:PST family polysaccharide transporter
MSKTDRFSKFSQTDGIRANLKQKSIRGAVFMAGGNSAELLIRVLAIAILARLLLPEEFGLIAMVTALTSILDGFRDFGLSAATVQRPDINHQQVSNLFWVNVSVGILLALALSSAAPLIAAFYHDQRLVGVSIALAFVFIWNGFAVQHEALMTRQLRQGELVLIRLIATVISLLIAIVLAVAGW